MLNHTDFMHNCHVGNNAKWGHKESEDVGSTGKTKAYSD